MAVVEVVTVVACERGRLLDLALDADEHATSLAASGERATTSTGRPLLGLGDEVTFRARHLGLTWRMTSRVTELEHPSRFVDEQVRGPFARLRHEHLFETASGAGTRMEVVAPLGPLGRPVAALVLAPYLRRLLRERAAHLRAVAEGPGPAVG